MKRAALGVRMHSGWGVLVAVSGDANSLEVEIIDRRRIVTTDPSIPGANQPYHYAASLGLSELGLPESGFTESGFTESGFAESGFSEPVTYLANRAAVSERLALAAVGEVVRELDRRHYRIVGSAVLLASGRPLPSLAKILASHPLIHTAEGEFFHHAVSKACEVLKISVTAIRERELEERAKTAFGNAASRVQRRISSLGSSLGPPWTKDHKTAALAAAMILAREETIASPRAAQKSGALSKGVEATGQNGRKW